jgi:hypothetical protein
MRPEQDWVADQDGRRLAALQAAFLSWLPADIRHRLTGNLIAKCLLYILGGHVPAEELASMMSG